MRPMKRTRAGGWLRVSSGTQDEQLQRGDIERFAASSGLEIVKWYTAHGKSASKGEQDTDMGDALEDVRSGVIKILVATALDRTERRGIEDQFRVIRQFREAGGDIWSVLESPVNGKPLEEVGLTLATIADMNRRKSELVKFSTKRGHDQIDANGAFRGRVPFGFEVTGPKYRKQLVPTEIGLEWVPQIYERIIRGDSLSVVCWWLDSLRIRFRASDHKDGKWRKGDPAPWWPASLMELIRNPVYVGHYCTDDGRWVHACDPIVDATTFRLANEALVDRARKQRGPRGKPENRAMLKSAIFCPGCGASMVKNQGSRNKTIYYRCRGRGPAQKGCGNNAPMDAVDSAVNRLIAESFHRPVMLRTLVKGNDHQAERDQIELQLRQLPSRGLSRADEQAERERLWAEQDRVAAMPAEEDRWELTPTGEFYDELYAALPVHERGAWMAAKGMKVIADKAQVKIQMSDLILSDLFGGDEVTTTGGTFTVVMPI